MTESMIFTAYPSDQNDGWTVWDHLKDEVVAAGISKADAVRIATQLEQEYWAK